MTKRILVALDPDADTPVATRHALGIAQRHGASVTGLAIIDAGHIETESRGGSLGGVYHTAALQESLTSEAQVQAKELLDAFEAAASDAGVAYEEHVRQGMPFQRIIDEMCFHDLLVMGEVPRFSYGQPQKDTKTLARVVQETPAPAFIVRAEREPPVKEIIIAFDGGESSARALHVFAQLSPFGTDLSVTLLHVHDGLPEASERLLGQAQAYLSVHGFAAKAVSVEGKTPHEAIIARVEKTGADVVVAGARSVSRLRRLAFGSNTAPLIEDCPAALFLHH